MSLSSLSRDRALARQAIVRRLLSLDETGTLQTVHVRIAAETTGVHVRTVWRWLAAAKESGRVEPVPRRGVFVLDDVLWARLGELGGNVKALYRWMSEHADDVLAGLGRDRLPSLTTLHDAVHRAQRAGRVLEVSRPSYARLDPQGYDRALVELALPGTIDEAGQAAVEPALQDDPDSSDAAGTSPFTDGVRLYVPGAHVVPTKQLGTVTEAIAHTIAARGVVCVYGDPGQGKTVAVHQALRLLPRRIPVHHARVAVKPALPQLRAALLTAFGLPATALTNRTDAADRALLEAFQAPGVLVIDDVQRIAAPELDYLRLLADAPTTQTSLVLCGAGAERTLARAPALASRVLTWQHVPRLETTQVPGVLRLFHPLWDTATDADLLHTDETRAQGNFRTWAKITSHAYAALDRRPEHTVDAALLAQACARLGPRP
ncbi:ATP-binding protein [Streptomyces sp. NBC_00825]|uniref:ATP-binding protein n=1 Tax=unclassified Streptomyces TaxID=2593676 RepID=UPI00225B4B84|nr:MULTISPECIES: ATP-binding protein [unclassified Streptomyces]WTB51755.1 ATP-binding protein [Streptomyces sp. NBC_00826]WTH95353.1 ATP-binding protein [Streptomyces sp. NBC_00825]WTI04087.1 ATP-binding protein [Streptomyces sp. NBC_00822]MCX4869686.1 ATP-binding protein [Streptomyces sp. NBC_00906]MCX4902641.1 ATP-binding protein [Streptomyces sp. NBC_00892]